MDNRNRYGGAVWKCLSIYDTFGEDSYKGYLFKLIVRMSNEEDLTTKKKIPPLLGAFS